MLALPPVPVEMDSSSDESSEEESDESDSDESEADEDIDKYERIARRRQVLAEKKEKEQERVAKEKRQEEREEYNEERDAALAKRDAVLAKRQEAAAAMSAAIKASDKDALEAALELGVNAGLEGGTRGKKWHTKEMAKGRFMMKQLVVRANLADVDANAEQVRDIDDRYISCESFSPLHCDLLPDYLSSRICAGPCDIKVRARSEAAQLERAPPTARA